MVGVPRSLGCLLCVKRRVRCDQQKPGCGNCAKYGSACPGYDRSRKFVAGKHQVRQRQKHSGADLSVLSFEDSAELVIRTIAGAVDSTTALSVPASLRDDRAAFVNTMMQNLYLEQSKEIMFWGPWLSVVPNHLGNKVTLDSAMCALILHLLGKGRNDQQLVSESRHLYGQSIEALQLALNHPVEWRSSETLCAAMILCMFELFADTTGFGAWMAHAGAVGWLMQQRGPSAYMKSWDRAMLFSFRGMIIMNHLFRLEECFLAKNKWQRIMRELAEEQVGGREPLKNKIFLIDIYHALLSKVPTILKYGFPLRMAKVHGMPVDLSHAKFIKSYGERLRTDFLQWFEKVEAVFGKPREVPSEDPSSPYPMVIAYENDWWGAIYIGYYTSLLIVQEFLNQVDYRQEYTDSNRDLAHKIYRSFETVGKGIMGPYRVGYAMRIAYDVADIPTQKWIVSLLERMSVTYGATNPSAYPPPSPNAYEYK